MLACAHCRPVVLPHLQGSRGSRNRRYVRSARPAAGLVVIRRVWRSPPRAAADHHQTDRGRAAERAGPADQHRPAREKRAGRPGRGLRSRPARPGRPPARTASAASAYGCRVPTSWLADLQRGRRRPLHCAPRCSSPSRSTRPTGRRRRSRCRRTPGGRTAPTNGRLRSGDDPWPVRRRPSASPAIAAAAAWASEPVNTTSSGRAPTAVGDDAHGPGPAPARPAGRAGATAGDHPIRASCASSPGLAVHLAASAHRKKSRERPSDIGSVTHRKLTPWPPVIGMSLPTLG